MAQAMTPLDQLHAVAPKTPILEVLAVLERGDVNQVPVTQDGRLLGMITRDHLLRVLYANLELSVREA